MRKPITDANQSAKIMFCFFHMRQRVWRYVQSSDNTHNYNKDLKFRELIRTLLSTPFLPVKKCQLPSRFSKVNQFSTVSRVNLVDLLPRDDQNPDLTQSNWIAIKGYKSILLAPATRKKVETAISWNQSTASTLSFQISPRNLSANKWMPRFY